MFALQKVVLHKIWITSLKFAFDLNRFLKDSREELAIVSSFPPCFPPNYIDTFRIHRSWSRFHSSPQIRRRPSEQFDGQEEIDNRVRATYRDLLTVSGARAWAGRRIRGWNFARRGWDRACGDGANCWKRSCRIRLPLLMDLLRGIPESSTLRIKPWKFNEPFYFDN